MKFTPISFWIPIDTNVNANGQHGTQYPYVAIGTHNPNGWTRVRKEYTTKFTSSINTDEIKTYSFLYETTWCIVGWSDDAFHIAMDILMLFHLV